MSDTARGYYWQCPVTHNTAAVIAHKESHARRWFSLRCPLSTWQFAGEDHRSDVRSTLVMAVLDEHGTQVHPK